MADEPILALSIWKDHRKLSADQLVFHYKGNSLVGIHGIEDNENAINYIECLITNLGKYKSKLEDFYGLKKYKRVPGTVLKVNLSYIYLMLDQQTGLYKIGRSLNPEYRERTLQSQAPMIEKIFTSPLTYSAIENKLHFTFKEKRVRGEWFRLCEDDIEYIINYDYKTE